MHEFVCAPFVSTMLTAPQSVAMLAADVSVSGNALVCSHAFCKSHIMQLEHAGSFRNRAVTESVYPLDLFTHPQCTPYVTGEVIVAAKCLVFNPLLL